MKDVFGFQTQGKNYDIYRPRYPQATLNNILSKVTNKNRFLDVATGTGIILFELAHHFKYSQGTDYSQKMISVCQQKIDSRKISGIELRCEDFFKAQYQENEKFDLITIGQALHFLPIRETLVKTRQLLAPGGVLSVQGYILDHLKGKNQQRTKELSEIYKNFYDRKVKKTFNFDRDEMHSHYSNKERYPFDEIFSKTTRNFSQVSLPMNKASLIAYLKTYSGYNVYLQKHIGEDPIKEVEEQIKEDEEIECVFDYFGVICEDQKKNII